ncbi:putative zinc finger protein 502, partial [Lasius niger]
MSKFAVNTPLLDLPLPMEETGPSKNLRVCAHCSKTFTNVSNLKRHLKTGACANLPVKPAFTCGQCNRSFTRLENLHNHFKGEPCHPASKQVLVCSKCNKVFTRPFVLKRHLKTEACQPKTCKK